MSKVPYEEVDMVFKDSDGHRWSSYNSYAAWCRACTAKTKPDKAGFDRDYYYGEVRITESSDPALQPRDTTPIGYEAANNGLCKHRWVEEYSDGPVHCKDCGVEAPSETIRSTLSETLAERKTQHGDFTDHAYCSQGLKIVLRDHLAARPSRGQPDLSHEQHEALEMILHKIARIVAGDANHLDHWHDIAGYATITAERIK